MGSRHSQSSPISWLSINALVSKEYTTGVYRFDPSSGTRF